MMNKTKPVYTPCTNITSEQRDKSDLVDKTSFRSLLGALLFISTRTRPDIAFAVNRLSRYCENPTKVDYDQAMMTLQYLKTTIDKSIHYDGNSKLTCYTDADWGGCEKTRRSTSGYIFLLGYAPIAWKSKRQRFVTLSATEAECVSLVECVKRALNIRKIIKETNRKDVNIKIFIDSTTCKSMVENEHYRGRRKLILLLMQQIHLLNIYQLKILNHI
eukprot:jgi/Orpsp1_1/1182896/evm.model.c7180000083102.2